MAENAAPAEQIDLTTDSLLETLQSTWDWITNPSTQTLIGIGVGAGVVILLIIIRMVLRSVARSLPHKIEDEHSWSSILDRTLSKFRFYFFAIIGIVVATQIAQAPDAVIHSVQVLLVVASVVQVAQLIQEFVLSILRRNALRGSGDKTGLSSALSVLKWFVNVAIWSIAFLMILSNLGFNVTGLVAGLGVGGIAIGLAAQDFFKDLFAALAILLDQPFKKGDFISSGDRILGSVEEIGMKTTRIRALSGEQVVLTNSNLLDLTLQNYGRMFRRRVVVQTGITYQTPADKIKRAAEIQKEAVTAQEKTTFDRAHFKGYGASSLDYELVFYVETPDYTEFMNIQQDILIDIFRKYEEEGLELAYPTRTLQLAAPNGEGVDVRELFLSPGEKSVTE